MDAEQDFLGDQSNTLEKNFFTPENPDVLSFCSEGSEIPQLSESKEIDKVKGSEKMIPKEKRDESSAFQEFKTQLGQEQDIEKKLRLSLDFMRSSLSQSTLPKFRDFWEGRKICLPLFKEILSARIRAEFWAEYLELSAEARRLKEILDEQTTFAAEQIELAIQALENDLQKYDELLLQITSIHIPEECISLQKKGEVYDKYQRELDLLNTLATRINSLRKEVIKTEMRIRKKNKFFERLSVCGDQIFPRRKEFIKLISQEFISDVDGFINAYFQDETPKTAPLFLLREEIKTLQNFAKQLTLNTQAFTETRLKLSECWDKLKSFEKERKKEVAQKKQVIKQNFDLVEEKIKGLADACNVEKISLEAANRRAEEIFEFMRTLELGREEIKTLKDAIYKARKGVLDLAKEEEKAKEIQEREFERQRKETLGQLKSNLEALLKQDVQYSIEKIIETRDELYKNLEQLNLSKIEKQIFDRLFRQIKDLVNDKKEKALLSLSQDDLHAIGELKVLLSQRKEERQEIKDQLENYRKALGGSGFDFEKAMMYRELIETEKERLEKVNIAIQDLEAKIAEIEG